MLGELVNSARFLNYDRLRKLIKYSESLLDEQVSESVHIAPWAVLEREMERRPLRSEVMERLAKSTTTKPKE